MKILLTIARYITGILFIFSGLVKANDPMGLSYKMQEFFEVWHLDVLNQISLPLSIAMIAFEIIAGVAVIIGWKFNVFSWLLLLLIIFFTFLTAYALFSGKIRECGCFGDCFKLTSLDSFIKDIILTLLIVFLFINRKLVSYRFHSRIAVICLLTATVFSFGIQWYVMKHLPIVDCLPYKIGSNIIEKRKIPQGAITDSTVINFVYKKQGREIEFDADHFPADFSDSLYEFVKRFDKLVRKGNAEPPIKDFVLINASNNDTTDAILSQPGKLLILFSKEWNSDWNMGTELIQRIAAEKNIGFIISTASADKARENLTVPVMKSDLVAIKTAARVDPTLYLLDGATIRGKWAFTDIDKAMEELKK
jgi:uncharacterized membrane protein YphA (DoxX/SURF4 family)